MFIELTIEFQSRGRTCNPKTGYFHDKAKIRNKNLGEN